MNERLKILFVKSITRSFTEKDKEILQKHFDVRIVDFVLSRKKLKCSLKTVFGMIIGVIWADVTFSWFASAPAFWAVLLSKIFRKKAIVVVGGYEVAKVTEIGYGLMLYQKSAQRVKCALMNASKILAVSEFSKKEILKNTNLKNVELVYNGIDCDKFTLKGEKEDLVITVGYCTKDTCKLKGIDTFVKASLAFPELKFVVIGNYDEEMYMHFKYIAPNVEFTGALSLEKVISWLKKAKVYCQLSYRESFGMSLAEAMSCGCIPVVTNRGAIPEVAGDIGFYVPYGEEKATIDAIKKALQSSKGKLARERIKNMFAIKKREGELIRIIEEM